MKYSVSKDSWVLLFGVTIIIGIASGLAGMFLDLLLHSIQHWAYGYGDGRLIDQENFLQGVSAATPLRRLMILIFCGLIAGLGWWLIYRYGKPLISISHAVKSSQPVMPIGTTIAHAVLQIITVGLGSPLGREVAPRELAAVFACWFSAKSGLGVRDTQVMVACAAGAGLAAVYNVPLGGTVFTLEVLLCTFHWRALVPALATSAIATVVSWIGLGNETQYHIDNFQINYSLAFWSLLVGPVFGMFGFWFNQITTEARKKAPHAWPIIILCLLNFTMTGLFSIYFPELLGNGKGPIQMGFTQNLTLQLAAVLLALRFFIVWSGLSSGAHGGLLTPSLANGVLLALVLGGLWSFLFPGNPPGAYAIIGAAAFLAASQKMPITAIVLTAELTDINFKFLIPILFAVTGSISTCALCAKIASMKASRS